MNPRQPSIREATRENFPARYHQRDWSAVTQEHNNDHGGNKDELRYFENRDSGNTSSRGSENHEATA